MTYRWSTSNWYILMKDELRSFEHITSFFLMIIGVIMMLYLFFDSYLLQIVSLFILKTVNQPSYYQLISFVALFIIIPIICVIVMYNSVSRDLEDERVRLILTKVRRYEYLLSKLLSRVAVMIASLFVIMLFISIYSWISIGRPFFGYSFQLFLLFSLLIIFLGVCFIFISCIFQNPLFVSLIFLILSLILYGFNFLANYSFYNYLSMGLTYKSAEFFILGTVLIFMTNVYYFNRKRL